MEGERGTLFGVNSTAERAFEEAMRRIAANTVGVHEVLERVSADARQPLSLRARLRAVPSPRLQTVWNQSDAHRFNASQADADAAIAEWRSFVDEIRR